MLGSAVSGSFFVGSGTGGAEGSLNAAFTSAAGLGKTGRGTASGVGGGRGATAVAAPLGLAPEADDDGRDCLPPSTAACVVLCLALEAVGGLGAGGTGVTVIGAGEPRGNTGSGKLLITGDEATDGDMPAVPFLLHEVSVSSL